MNCHFQKREMESLFPDAIGKVENHFLEKYQLNKIAPHKRTRLIASTFARHPIIFITRENPLEEEEKEMIRGTPAYKNILKKAYENNGCVKFFDQGQDVRMLTKEDFIFAFGDKGKAKIKALYSLGKEFNDLTGKV